MSPHKYKITTNRKVFGLWFNWPWSHFMAETHTLESAAKRLSEFCGHLLTERGDRFLDLDKLAERTFIIQGKKSMTIYREQ